MPLKLTNEPAVDTKIHVMAQRIRWQQTEVTERDIDQTRLVLEDGQRDTENFSFLVVGDSGTGRRRTSSPQRQVAQQLLAHGSEARFTLHTGDVVYLVGSREQYHENFIKPYREWLVGGENYSTIAYDRMVFQRPILPVLGNHDYYDLPWWVGLLSGITLPLRYALRSYVDIDVGWHGSFEGDAYARAFLDYLRAVPPSRLGDHLDRHYTSSLDGHRCLSYRPGEFTRLPNRYYHFRYGGIDFFALDSNTFNQPLPLKDDGYGGSSRQTLIDQAQALEEEKNELLRQAGLDVFNPATGDHRDDITEDLEAINEQLADIEKQLSVSEHPTVDVEQLDWLRDGLIASWQNPEVRGRILFFHHPPYVSEATKWPQGQTLAVRHHIREVLDAVEQEVGDVAQDRPLVDLVLNGHAHCLDYMRTEDTGHGDRHIPWVVCGGSGYSLRRQRSEGPEITEVLDKGSRVVARSHLYLGRAGKGRSLKRPYSGLKVEVQGGTPLKFTLTPLVAERVDGDWQPHTLEPFTP
jgi:hypothetical protein